MTPRPRVWWLVTLLVALWLLSMTMRSQEAATTYLAPITTPARARGISTRVLISFLGNIVVFVPLGAAATLAQAKRPPPARMIGGTLVGAGLSALIELLQLGVPGRVTAWDDLALNTLGAAVGALLANVARYVGERLRHPSA